MKILYYKLLFKVTQFLANTLPHEYKTNLSDGYHSYQELYAHRVRLYIALCKKCLNNKDLNVYKSVKHSDGTCFPGYFLLVLQTKHFQMSYHLENMYWAECLMIPTIHVSPHFDGHTSKDVLTRLMII